MKHVLVFGAGLVARPLVRYLLNQPGFSVTVASRTLSKAEALVGDHPQGKAVAFDVTKDSAALGDLIAEADLAVSLLPYIYHVQVAEQCVHHCKSLVTTSYVSDGMRALDGAAREAGIILLNEIGLDPGIDHMSAMRIIHRIHDAGGEVKSFRSYCGGLPAPDANDNPLGYKFSWSPRGVVLAGRNDARYKENGHIVEVPNARLFATHFVTRVEGLGDFEAYPNRDSLPYIEIYGIPETSTMYRGTLRNLGWCDVMQKLNELGYFSLDERADLTDKTFRQVMAELVYKAGEEGKEDTADLEADLAASLNLSPNSGVMLALEWLGLLSDAPVSDKTTLLDILADQMLVKMPYREGERDMVVLAHEFVAVYPGRRTPIPGPSPCEEEGRQTPISGPSPCEEEGRRTPIPDPSPCEEEGRRTPIPGPSPCEEEGRRTPIPDPSPCEEEGRQEYITSTLIDFGVPGEDTSMAHTVGSPAAIGARMILEGEIKLTGVHIPVLPEIYEPVLGELEQLGIACVEKTDVERDAL